MKISRKLTGLIAIAAVMSSSLFGLIAYRDYTAIRNEQKVAAAEKYIGPLRKLGEGLYRHQLALLVAQAANAPIDESFTHSKTQIRAAIDQLEAANRDLRINFGRETELSGIKPPVERILSLNPRPDLAMPAIVEQHQAAFVQLREFFYAAMHSFDVLTDPEEDIILTMIAQFEVFPGLLIGRANLIGRIYLFDLAREGDAVSIADRRSHLDAIQRQIGALQELIGRSSRTIRRAGHADLAGRGWDQHMPATLALLERNGRFAQSVSEAVVNERAGPTLIADDADFLDALLASWYSLSNTIEAAIKKRLSGHIRDLYIQSAVVAGLMIILFAPIWWTVRSVTRDINAAEAMTTRIAAGDLDLTVEGQERPDEIGSLARAVEVLRRNSEGQREAREKERALMARMSETGVNVSKSVQAIRAAANEISQGKTDLAARTERQASALQQTVATMAEISATVTTNAQNSEQSRKLAADALARAEGGGTAVSSVVKAMAEIEKSSARIAEIIRVMEEISFQTKLLALNAAVEAAHAGESGKGFAVVAQEVRSLADRSRQASQQIRDLIAASSREVGQGVKLSGDAGEALTSIIEIVRRVAEIAPEIAAGSREQARSITEINKALKDLDAGTQQNAALVEENSAAVASLADQAGQLVKIVSGFDSGGEPAEAPPSDAAIAPKARPKTTKNDDDWDGEF